MKTRIEYFVAAALLALSFMTVAQAQSVEGSFQRTLNVSGPVDLEVSTGSGGIRVMPGSAGRVEVRATIRAGQRWWRSRVDAERLVRQIEANPPVEQIGNTVRIGRIDDPEARRNVSISYEIATPPDTRLRGRTGSGGVTADGVAGPVDVTTGSGGITVTNVRAEVHAETGSGSLRLTDVGGSVTASTGSGGIVAQNIGGAFRGSTGSGSIRMTQSGSGNVEVTTGSGSIDVSGVKGALRVRTGSGGITAGGEPAGRWDLQAGSGSVAVRLPPQAAFDLDARTNSGSVTVDHPITVSGTIRKNQVTGSARGGGNLLEVRTGSGSIRIQ